MCAVPNAWAGKKVMLGWGGEVGLTTQPTQPWSFFIFTVTRGEFCTKAPPAQHHPNLSPEPGGEQNLGRILFYLIKYLRLQERERKETASLTADSLFNQLHTKRCTEKKLRVILYRYMWPALLRKLYQRQGGIEHWNNAVQFLQWYETDKRDWLRWEKFLILFINTHTDTDIQTHTHIQYIYKVLVGFPF